MLREEDKRQTTPMDHGLNDHNGWLFWKDHLSLILVLLRDNYTMIRHEIGGLFLGLRGV